MRSDESISELVSDAISRDTWIFDGNYSRNFYERASRSDTIVFLDIPRWLCLFRVTKRALSQLGKSRSDMADDCPERIDGAFWEFLKFIYNYPSNGRLKALKLLEEAPASASVFHLRSRGDVDKFLQSV
ncbi:MAG: DNA topology modulation protein FlaR [Pseudomonadota bacterium]